MAIGSTFHNDNYYPYPAWGSGGVYYGGRPYYPPPYRPAYPAYRPAYGYNPPANYRWNQYNRNVNVNYNNNNYYSRFQNQNRTTQLPANTGGNIGRNVGTLPATNQPNWKGQTAYQGARGNAAQGQRPGASMANAVPPNVGGGNRGSANVATREANRPNAQPNVNRPNAQPNVNRPNNAAAGAANRPARTNAAASPQPNPNRGGDRGYGGGAQRTQASRPAASPSPAAQNRGGGAFGGGNSGASERTASNRGRASSGGGGGGARSGGGRRG